MELKEQIIKAIIELRVHGLANGGTIGYHAGWCDDVADRLANALSLIKELTEENEGMANICNANDALISKLQKENKKLTINMNAYGLTAKRLGEENERLKNRLLIADEDIKRLRNRVPANIILTAKDAEKIKTECLEKIELDVKAIKADTVRKMQERLDKHFCHDPAFLGVEQRLIMDVIDQIAKEMVEDNT